MNNLEVIEKKIDNLLVQLDLAVLNGKEDVALEIGQAIETLINELNADIIRLRIIQ